MYQPQQAGYLYYYPYKVCNNEVISIEVSALMELINISGISSMKPRNNTKPLPELTAQYYTITAVGSYRYTPQWCFFRYQLYRQQLLSHNRQRRKLLQQLLQN
ncbi:MAG: hypothetical protein IPL35_04750 [Sphingobacteriales bacterium]|nr:hypothetical protein [Sphingobacteriales bacterium]